MARGRSLEDSTTLRMALVGYQVEKQRIEDQIRRIEAQLKGKRVPLATAAPAKPAVRRVLSPAARARIAAAQKKRWAEHRKRVAQNKQP
ncbi:MAG: hypothetical protein ABSH42_12015 [Bryobacteraceae bacterium]|jgi:hypothetical protein